MKWAVFATFVEVFLAATQVFGQSSTDAPLAGNVSISLPASPAATNMAGSMSSTGMGAPSVVSSSLAPSTSLPTSLPVVTSSSASMAPVAFVPFASRPPPNTSLPVTVAIICACLMFLLVIILFIIVALILKHLKVQEAATASSPIKGRGGDGAFYGAPNPQSNQALVGSMSSQSFASSSSDPRLNVHAQGAQYNRGFEGDHGPAAVNYVQEGNSSVEIGGRKRLGQSKA